MWMATAKHSVADESKRGFLKFLHHTLGQLPAIDFHMASLHARNDLQFTYEEKKSLVLR